MSLGDQSMSEAPVAANGANRPRRPPPNRQTVAKVDTVAQPEPR